MTVLAPLLSSAKQNWRTPLNLLTVIRRFSSIGLDPCGHRKSIVNAQRTFYYPSQDGLALPWSGHGLVYCNPPYGREVQGWIEKMKQEAARGVEILALVAARPETNWMQDCFANMVCFWRGRLTFLGAKFPAPFPSAILAYTPHTRKFREVFSPHGIVVRW